MDNELMFREFINECTTTAKSVEKYIGAFRKIASTLQRLRPEIKSVYDISNVDEAVAIRDILYNDEDFKSYNYDRGNNMYSAAYDWYIRFLHAKSLFSPKEKNIEKEFIDQPLQLIYYGAPGTGKSHTIDKATNESNSVRTTFHPDSDYAGFVGAYKPTMENVPMSAFVGKEVHLAQPQGDHTGKERKIVYKYVPQAFLKAYVEAWKRYADGSNDPYYLVIEEINRGNCAQIFGDLFQLLDRNNMGCSSYAISADEDIAQFLREDKRGFGLKVESGELKVESGGPSQVESGELKVESGGLTQEQRDAIAAFVLHKDSGSTEHVGPSILNGSKLLLPPNLRIWATMNTSDQSLFPIDSAFKRRWNWEYMPIDTDPIDTQTKEHLKWKIQIGNTQYYWGDFLDYINPKIFKLTLSEDKQMGYFFAKPDKDGDTISEKVFVNKVLFYMWTDIFKDYDLTDKPFVYETTEDGKPVKKSYRFTDFFGKKAQENLVSFIKGMGLFAIESGELKVESGPSQVESGELKVESNPSNESGELKVESNSDSQSDE